MIKLEGKYNKDCKIFADDIEEKLLHVMLACKGRSFPSVSSCKAGAHAYARGVCKS